MTERELSPWSQLPAQAKRGVACGDRHPLLKTTPLCGYGYQEAGEAGGNSEL